MDVIEVSFDLPCGESSHPVSMTLTSWGTVVVSSPCLLLPESARRLAGSTCLQKRDDVQLSVMKSVLQALYGSESVQVPDFLRSVGGEISTGGTKSYDTAAEAVAGFLTRLREQRESLPKAVLQENGYLDLLLSKSEDGFRRAFAAELPAVRWAAAIVVGEKKLATLVPELMRISEDEDFGVQVAAVRALAVIADARAAPILCRWLGEKRLILEIRSQIARALGQIGNAQAVEPLIKALGDEDERVRLAAAEALGQIGDARAVEPLIKALRDWGARHAAAEALGQIGDARAVAPLIKALRDEDERVRLAAAEALGQIGNARAVQPLIKALRDESEGIRDAAVEALVRIGRESVEPLITVLRDRNERVREAAVEALVRIGRKAVEPLIEALGNEDERVRLGAARALGQIGDARAVEPLIMALGIREFINLVVRSGAPALKLLIGTRVTHSRYGGGVVEKIFSERSRALVVRFESLPDGERLQVVPLREITEITPE